MSGREEISHRHSCVLASLWGSSGSRQNSNICILCSKNTSAASWWFLGVQQQMSRRDGTAPGSADIKEPRPPPAWNVATERGNCWSEACWANTINLKNGKGQNFCEMATFWGHLIEENQTGWAQGGFLPPRALKTFSISGKSLIYWY